MSTEPRIYVACLASYNAGKLHGEWIDCEGLDADDIYQEIDKILRSSPCPNVIKRDYSCEACSHDWTEQVDRDDSPRSCPECGDGAVKASKPFSSSEEWAIHDTEGFGTMVSEHSSIDEIVEFLELIEEFDHDLVLAASELAVKVYNLRDVMESCMCRADSRSDLAYDLLCDNGPMLLGEDFAQCMDSVWCYFDHNAWLDGPEGPYVVCLDGEYFAFDTCS
jgi:antirestriction protein